MSAFIKRQPATAVDLGTRPGLNGQILISSGVAGIDKLLGGGVPLGSLLLIVEDSQSQHHLNLVKCFLAEGLCCKHTIAFISAQQHDVHSMAGFVPGQAKNTSSGTSTSNAETVAASAVGSTSRRDTAPGSATAADDGLKIAWQYRKYIQNQQRAASTIQQPDRLKRDGSGSSSSSTSASAAAKAIAAGVGREWCHHFDLSSSFTADAMKAAKLHVECCCSEQQHGSSAVQAAARAAAHFLSKFQPKGPGPVPSRDPASIGRVVLQSLGSPEWWPQSSNSNSSSDSLAELEGVMLQAVMKLRLAVQDASCAAVMTCPASMYSESFQAQLQHLADIVLCVQSLADDSDIYRLLPDPTSAAALLEVRRVPELGLLRQRYSEDRLYLIRMKRRSISVGVLDLIPLEASDAQGDKADQRNTDKPTAAKLCGSGPAASGLDF